MARSSEPSDGEGAHITPLCGRFGIPNPLIASHVHIQHPLNGPKYAKIFTHIIIFFLGVVEYSGKGLSMIPHVHSLVILDPVDKLDSSFDPIYWTHPKGFSSESLLKSPVFP